MRKPGDRWLAPLPGRWIGRQSRHSGAEPSHRSGREAPIPSHCTRKGSMRRTDARPRCRGGRYAGRYMQIYDACGRTGRRLAATGAMADGIATAAQSPLADCAWPNPWPVLLAISLASAPFYPFYPWLRQRDCATAGGIEKPRGCQDRSPQSEGSHARFASLHFQPGEDSRLPPGYCGQSRAAHRPFAQALGRQRSGRTSPTDGDERWRR